MGEDYGWGFEVHYEPYQAKCKGCGRKRWIEPQNNDVCERCLERSGNAPEPKAKCTPIEEWEREHKDAPGGPTKKSLTPQELAEADARLRRLGAMLPGGSAGEPSEQQVLLAFGDAKLSDPVKDHQLAAAMGFDARYMPKWEAPPPPEKPKPGAGTTDPEKRRIQRRLNYRRRKFEKDFPGQELPPELQPRPSYKLDGKWQQRTGKSLIAWENRFEGEDRNEQLPGLD